MSHQPPSARMRLQKFLSDAGVASRRNAEELILAGRVLVNDEIVEALPAFVDPARDRVVVDGSVVRSQSLRYFLLHKPKGVVCTHRDPAGRMRAVDLLPPLKERLFPVGRLDADSSGLLLMTNDGELAEQIAHPRYGVPKVYRAEVRGRVPADLAEQLMRGVYLSEGKVRASAVEVVRAGNEWSILKITLREGRNRQVRRMLARLGHPVRDLKRVEIGRLSLKGLPVGAARPLRPHELAALRAKLAVPRPGSRRGSRKNVRRGAGRAARRQAASSSPRRPAPSGPTDGGGPPGKSPRRRIVT